MISGQHVSQGEAQAGVQRDPGQVPAPFTSHVTGLITSRPEPTLPHLSEGDSHPRFPGDLNWPYGGQWWWVSLEASFTLLRWGALS